MVQDTQALQIGYKAYISHWQVLLDRIDEIANSGQPIGYEMTAEDLFKSAIKYFKWCDDHPINKPEMARSGKKIGTIYGMLVPRPYSIHGLCIHVGVTKEYLYDVSKSETKNDFYFVVSNILAIIHTQKMELATIGVYNPIIIAKELGLDKEIKNNPGGGTINITVDGASPPLLENENDVEDIPNSQIQNLEI